MTTSEVILANHSACEAAKAERESIAARMGASFYVNRKGVICITFGDGVTLRPTPDQIDRLPLPLTPSGLLAAMGQAPASTPNPQS